jgi:DNA mismatch repair protein MutS2
MDARTLRSLEYDKIKERLASEVGSEPARELARALQPATDLDTARRLQGETSEARDLLDANRGFSVSGLRDIREPLLVAGKGGALDATELLDIAQVLAIARRTAGVFRASGTHYPRLARHADALVPLPEVENRLRRCFDDKGEMTDHASPRLAQIRGRLQSARQAVISRVEGVIKSTEFRPMLREAIVTIRAGRYCVPVRSEFKGEFRGIVHDTSSSGATLFMEPLGAVEANNELTELHRAEGVEMERILRELSELVGAHSAEIDASLQALVALDFIAGRAHLGHRLRGVEPVFTDNGLLDLHEARHPLLSDPVVANDVRLGDEFTGLVITGPNTGGKTVLLKTVGLLALMAQSGIPIPAMTGSRLPFYRRIFADIGDEQSIEQSLSTFSSHMTQIALVVREAQPGDLALLDEIGAGTDPAEGAGLAKAVLSALVRRGAQIIATTHYGELKSFAYLEPGVENASVEFDSESLRPTFRLRIGLPGSSNAFSIAARIGLPPEIVEEAEASLGESRVALEQLIRQLGDTQRGLERERSEAQLMRSEVEALESQYRTRLAEIEGRRLQELRKAHDEAEELVLDTRRQVAALLDALRAEAREARRAEGKTAPTARAEVSRRAREELGKIGDQVAQNAPEPLPSPTPRRQLTEVTLGQTVMIPAIRQRGIVVSLPDDEGEVALRVGILNVKVPLADLEYVEETRAPAAEGDVARLRFEKRAVADEIHLRGMRVDEALYELDKYLDDALMAGLPEVRIVHGRGTGAVRRAVEEELRRHPRVASYRLGGPGEGGEGVTVATLQPGAARP